METPPTRNSRKRAESLDEFREIMSQFDQRELTKQAIASYVPRPTDVVVTPFGKSGTTWTQQIVHTLRTRGDMDFDDISRVVPWIETSGRLGIDINAEQKAEPRAFKSHLPADKIPPGARYINVIRNPVDAAFSGFKFMEGWYLEPGCVSADDFVAMSTAEGGYQKHFVSWWERRTDDDVLYLVFEHMKEDLEGTIEKIAAFMDIELDDELRAITLEHASLPFMQRHKDRFDDAMMRQMSEEDGMPAGSDSSKVRAGLVGVHELSQETVDSIHAHWREVVEPVTGFATYESLIASLR